MPNGYYDSIQPSNIKLVRQLILGQWIELKFSFQFYHQKSCFTYKQKWLQNEIVSTDKLHKLETVIQLKNWSKHSIQERWLHFFTHTHTKKKYFRVNLSLRDLEHIHPAHMLDPRRQTQYLMITLLGLGVGRGGGVHTQREIHIHISIYTANLHSRDLAHVSHYLYAGSAQV